MTCDNTLTATSTALCHSDYEVVVYYDHNSTTTGTSDYNVFYRVKLRSDYCYDLIPMPTPEVIPPTAKEIHRKAGIEGGMAQAAKHSRVPKKALVARTSYRGMARLPCYRGKRAR